MMLLAPFLALLALEVKTIAASAVTATGSQAAPHVTVLPAALFPGPQRDVVTGPHPAFPASWLATGTVSAATACKNVQYAFPAGTNKNTGRANAVRNLYEASWNQYAQYCFGHDQLYTEDNTCADDIFGWGATIVDGIDTAIIMNLTDIVTQQLAFIETINFSKANGLVDGFDAVIRYLAGLLSAYDILTSGYVPEGTYDAGHVNALLSQAKTLGDNLKAQFGTSSGLPVAAINITTGELFYSTFTNPIDNKTYYSTNTAQAGSLILEFYRLADLTGDDSFRTLANNAEGSLIFPYPAPTFAGLVGSTLDTNTGNFLTYDYGWQAGIDSFIEYLIKTYYYQPSSSSGAFLKDFWVDTAKSTVAHIALHPYNHSELTFITQHDIEGNPEYVMDDYACFSGGNLLLGGIYLGMPDVYDLGLAVTDSCHNFYNTTKTGLGPLGWAWYNASDLAYDPSDNTNAAERAMFDKLGYFIPDGDGQYGSFPETIESIFYAYRITGDKKWQNYNWGIYQHLVSTGGFGSTPSSPITDVNTPGSFSSELPSFYFAEVLKYLFLSFTDPDVINLNDWVFNTESHPFLRNAAACT